MYIIVGLGNPTAQYEGTRHNVGFDVIDTLAEKYHIALDMKKHRAYCGKGVIAGTEGDSGKAADIYELKRRKCKKSCGLLQD